jgi:hypothetical protein
LLIAISRQGGDEAMFNSKLKTMKIITVTLTITLFILTGFFSNAQELSVDASIINKLTALKAQKEKVVINEKEALSKEVLEIMKRLEDNEISATEAEKQKVVAAEKHALNIDNKTVIIDNKIALLERNGNAEDEKIIFNLSLGDRDEYNSKISSNQRRTYSSFVFAFGLNNAIIDGQSLDDSPYQIGGSRFTELGIAFTTRLLKDAGWLRLRYGVSFQFNGLKPTDNNYFVSNGNETTIEEFPTPLDKSKLRLDNLVVPIHFEFGPSKRIEKNDNTYFSSDNKFKIGLGGYAGLNLSTMQKLKYNENGAKVKEKISESYNTNNIVYGLSGYIGWDAMSLYVKYDLNPIFDAPNLEQRNISLGLRWDWD